MNKKQLAIIYRMYKEDKLPDVTKEDINKMYSYVDKWNYDYDFKRKEGNFIIDRLKEIVELAFNGEIEKVNERLKGFRTVDDF